MADDKLDDRLSRRFEGRESDEEPEGTQTDMSSSSQIDKTAQKSQKVKNIKKEWNVRSIYLDDDLNSSRRIWSVTVVEINDDSDSRYVASMPNRLL